MTSVCARVKRIETLVLWLCTGVLIGDQGLNVGYKCHVFVP